MSQHWARAFRPRAWRLAPRSDGTRPQNSVPPALRDPGDAVKLCLRPWAEMAATYDAINRSELDDENLLLAEPAWGE